MILDTNALWAIAEGEPQAVAEIAKARWIAVPVIVLGEYRFGVAQSRRRAEYERWLAKFLSACRVLEVSADTATGYAELRLKTGDRRNVTRHWEATCTLSASGTRPSVPRIWDPAGDVQFGLQEVPKCGFV